MAMIIDFFKEHLFWIIFFIAGAFLFFIYSRLDQATKNTIKKFFSGKTLTFTILIIVWIIWHNTGDVMTIKNSTFFMPLLSLAIIAGINFIGGLRYETPQIICANGFHGSYSKPPARINGFLLFAIDSFNAGGLSWDYASRILVLREETVEFCDQGAISIAKPTPCNTWAYDLEPEIKEYIENNICDEDSPYIGVLFEDGKPKWFPKEVNLIHLTFTNGE